VLKAAVDRLGRPIRCAGTVEVGEHVDRTLGQGPAESADLFQTGWDTAADRGDQVLHHRLAPCSVGIAVCGDHPLVDAPRGLDRDVLLDLEERIESGCLLLGQQVLSGVQGPPGPVERVVLVAAVAVQVLLDPSSALVEGVAGQANDVEGIHDRAASGSSSTVADL